MQPKHPAERYAGFWIRFAATLIDTWLIGVVTLPMLFLLHGHRAFSATALQGLGWGEVLVSYILPAALVIGFWIRANATPGKIVLALEIVDAVSGRHPSKRQYLIRYLGFIIGVMPLCAGLLWVALDPRKQGWHDKLARTAVVYK